MNFLFWMANYQLGYLQHDANLYEHFYLWVAGNSTSLIDFLFCYCNLWLHTNTSQLIKSNFHKLKLSHRNCEHGGGSSKFDGEGGGLKSKHRGAWGELKMLSKNTCEGVHLIVKLLAISLQASKFTKNEFLHTHFSRILARFYVIIFCAFSRNHFMEGFIVH